MKLRWRCPGCESIGSAELVEGQDVVRCSHCDQERSIRPVAARWAADSPSTEPESDPLSCPVCGTEMFYVQKDFPPRLGVLIVGAGIVGSSVFTYYLMPFWAVGVLLLTAVIDGVLYKIVPDVLTCYRCEAQIAGCSSERVQAYRPFDLAIGERYRQERLRVEQLRQQRADSTTSAD